MRRDRLALAGLAVLALAGAVAAAQEKAPAFDREAQVGPDPVLPEPQNYLLPPMNIARAVGWKQGESPSVPDDMRIRLYANGLAHPRMVHALPNGDVLVVESKAPGTEPIQRPKDVIQGYIKSFASTSQGSTPAQAGGGEGNRITLLRDADGDGTPEVRSVFLDHLHSPFGVALVGNDLYVANTDALVRYPYTPGETRMTAPGTVLTELPGGPIDHHWTKALTASPDGTKLYVGVGSNSNITEHGLDVERERAAVWEIDRSSGAHRLFAEGVRNPTGLAFEPQSGRLWAIANERDEIGPHLVPDYLTSLQDGGFYGWPYSYYGQHLDPRVRPQRPDLVARAIPPDYALGSHVAPLGLVFSPGGGGGALPARYAGGAFIGEHGSWDRPDLSGYKVVFVPFENGRPSGKAQDVVTNFLNGQGESRGRPVGVTLDRTGALLIADDTGDTVWRVTSAQTNTAATGR
ncbi:PQQ-dependent sugar dehydrogenase [Paracraurococcus lichenis]|uniref:Sorbosone dehydrogenase family protein n=1 Tax=Paracraurococcus lichenis TaxID=3064888 RepID=A0ABT9DV14_9PROT|nr:sorbosone dehydrogenase family protein [Paracraurococcus sp. LOR1-02]MDO9707740.1 sorbosone dehydrogenase family protein [Paracraurococcus sp. LOR1-02]